MVKQFVTFHILYPTALKPIAVPHQPELNFDGMYFESGVRFADDHLV